MHSLHFNICSFSKGLLYIDKSSDATTFYTKTGLELFLEGKLISDTQIIKQDENVSLDDIFYLAKILKNSESILDEIFL